MQQFKLLILFFFFQQFLVAQQFLFKNINTSYGLFSSEVYDVLEDRKGHMWFTTDQGVARYNGKEFTAYTITDGLRDNTVFRMSEDHKGRIWFASQHNEQCYWQNDAIYKSPLSDLFHSKIFSTQDPARNFFIDSSDSIRINTRKDVTCKSLIIIMTRVNLRVQA